MAQLNSSCRPQSIDTKIKAVGPTKVIHTLIRDFKKMFTCLYNGVSVTFDDGADRGFRPSVLVSILEALVLYINPFIES